MHPLPRLGRLAFALWCALLAAPAFADAQGDRIRALEQRLDASLKVIEALSARLAALEQKAPATAASSPPVPVAATAAVAALEERIAQLSDGMNQRRGDAGLALHGFADVGAAWSTRDDPVRLRGFNAGTLDLYLTPQFGDRAKGLIELAVEYGGDGHVAIDLERLQLGYTVNDALTLWLGRFHTPYGLWNTAYHHGANLQTSISRPRFIEFEDKGGLMPAHTVGAWASGRVHLGSARGTYDVYLTNGPRIAERTLDFGAFSDGNANKMLGGNLGYQPGGALEGLTVGVHAFGAKAPIEDLSGAVIAQSRLRMAGAYVAYDENDWDVLGEFYRFANVNLGDATRHTSRLGFLQVGRTFGAWTPFARWERAALDPTDDYFRSQAGGRSYRRTALGVRYALDAKSSFKLEFNGTRESAADLLDENGAIAPFAARSYRRAAMQYSVAF